VDTGRHQVDELLPWQNVVINYVETWPSYPVYIHSSTTTTAHSPPSTLRYATVNTICSLPECFGLY